jgi:hypothetical protein
VNDESSPPRLKAERKRAAGLVRPIGEVNPGAVLVPGEGAGVVAPLAAAGGAHVLDPPGDLVSLDLAGDLSVDGVGDLEARPEPVQNSQGRLLLSGRQRA